ncbi:MAG TPA: tartrate dehydrogenase [Firmicutes bacterium]|nr:tartrate dehydrogenase [Bacillota bacterium]
MKRYHIAVIPGDGIGKEVVPEGLKALKAIAECHGGLDFQFEEFPWGCEYYLKTGSMMPQDGLDILKNYDAILFGAVGSPGVPDYISLWGLLLPIRKTFDQYVNLRPIQLLPGVSGPLRDKGPEDIDFVVVRENTEGEYAGAGGRIHVGTSYEVALQTGVFTRHATERIIRYAFELARERGRRKRLTGITKSNAWNYGMVFWDEVFKEVGRDFPDVEARLMHVDAAAMMFVLHPEEFDVVVGSNLFADILTDLGAAIQGSLGLAPSANINPERKFPSLFEPTHGSAPDIAGKGIANPIGTLWSIKMMLDFLGEAEAADVLMNAIKQVLLEGKVRTPDLGGTSTTQEVGGAVCRLIKKG